MANRLILMPTAGPGTPPVEAGQGSGETLLSGEYLTRTWNHYSGENGRLYCGIWESTPGKVVINYTEWEFCHLIEGRVVITSETGEEWQLGQGDAFMIPAGFRGTWETVETARKHYVILTPEPEGPADGG
jgi:uncharacterized cupin superfamily protein